jgi:large subunit ribosomal protein L15
MTERKRKKNSRQRGNHTHGWGAKKKHRGAGNRGGRGTGGSGKRGDSKKPSIWKNKKYFGRHGFKKLGPVEKIKAINLSYFEVYLPRLVEKKLAEEKGGIFTIDVEKLGFNKVLSSGKLTKKCKISSPSFSKKAIEKIKSVGGEAVETRKKQEKPKTEAKKEEKTKEVKQEGK